MKKIFISSLLALVLVVTGCSKGYLDTEPSSSISDITLAKSDNGIQGVLNGINNMMYMYVYRQGTGTGAASLNVKFDLLSNSSVNSIAGFHMDEHRWTDHRNPYGALPYYSWDYYYTIIQHCNTVLQLVDKSMLEEKVKNDVKAEALAFRAMCYLQLTQLFGERYVKGGDNKSLGVILRLEPSVDALARSTVEECFAQINKDINDAISAFEAGTMSYQKDYHKNRLTLPVAYGLAARVALAQQDFARAEMMADKAIKAFVSVGGRLQNGSELVDGFNNMNAKEWMWGYRHAEDQNTYFAGFGATYAYNFPGWNDGLRFAVNRSYYDAMGKDDARRGWFVALDEGDKIPDDGDDTYFAGEYDKANIKWEYTGQCIKFRTLDNTTSKMDLVMMRLGEMYYIKAEAQALQNKLSDASATLMSVMVTRDSQYKVPAGLDQAGLLWEIQRNKRIDMYWEGQAFFDMKRLGELPNRLAAGNDMYMDDVHKAAFKQRNSGNNVSGLPKTADDKVWQFVIPYDELKGNNLCEQNPL